MWRSGGNTTRMQLDLSVRLTAFNGMKQGGALFCLLFNLPLWTVIRDSQILNAGTVFYKLMENLACAYGIDVGMLQAQWNALFVR